eukprot:jgi/Mesen1/9063/ME000578S08313
MTSAESRGAPEAASARAPPEDWDWRRAAVVGAGAALYAAAQAAPAVALDALEEACAEELGGADPNAVILVACIVQALALTGAFVGGTCVARARTQPPVAPLPVYRRRLSIAADGRPLQGSASQRGSEALSDRIACPSLLVSAANLAS